MGRQDVALERPSGQYFEDLVNPVEPGVTLLREVRGKTGSQSGTSVLEVVFTQFMWRYPESPMVHDLGRWTIRIRDEGMRERKKPYRIRQCLRPRSTFGSAPTAAGCPGRDSDSRVAAFLGLACAGFRAKKCGLSRLSRDGRWNITNGPHRQRDAPDYLVELIGPGHNVLIEGVRAVEAEVCDPSADGQGQPGKRRYLRVEWVKVWDGVTLRLDR